ncbi:MAG TPA: hypothetical protein VMT10_01425 [Solirubrobacteraceae bacterium]|nr:hypothetical protein [Solirubrobacteraceae bacterium]
MRLRLAAVPVAALAVALAGCAGQTTNNDTTSKFTGQQKLIAQTVEDLQTATEKSNESKICGSLVTTQLQQQIGASAGAKGCTAAVKQAIKNSDQSDLTVRSVTIDPTDATKATAVVSEKTDKHKSRTVTLQFQKQGISWRISSFGA